MIEPPESAGGGGSAPPAAAAAAPPGPTTRVSGPVTAAEEIPSGPRTGAESGPVEVQPDAPRGPRAPEIWALEIELVLNDPVEITGILEHGGLRPLVIDPAYQPGRLEEIWGLYGGEGPHPAAFTDNAGAIYIDAAQVPHAIDMVTSTSPERMPGPLRPEEGLTTTIEDPETRTSREVPVPAPPAYSREVARVISDPVDASRAFHAENDAGRVVWLVKDASILSDIWNGQYGQSGSAPAAWVNGAGVLTVDVLRVDTVNRPTPEVPVSP
jgi:hypothetical protein